MKMVITTRGACGFWIRSLISQLTRRLGDICLTLGVSYNASGYQWSDCLCCFWNPNRLCFFGCRRSTLLIWCSHTLPKVRFSLIARDREIKAWLYDNMGSRVDYDAPGLSSTKMAYNADGPRLFSCEANKEGKSFMVEWNESGGVVKRTYFGLGKRFAGVVQFNTTKNRFLAGDEFIVKFWDINNLNP